MAHPLAVPGRMCLVALLALGCLVAVPALAQNTPKPAPKVAAKDAKAPAAVEEEEDNLFRLLVKGGVVMIPIGLCSIAALGMAVERFISLRRKRIIPPDFISGLKGVFGGSADISAGLAYCEKNPSPISNIFRAGIAGLAQGHEQMEKGIEDAGGREVYKMKRSLKPLSFIAVIEPLLGLLGTVYGMISAFKTTSSGQDVGQLARGIYEALVTTAAGLTVAIPVMIVYQVLAARVDVAVDEIDEEAIRFLESTRRPAASVEGSGAKA